MDYKAWRAQLAAGEAAFLFLGEPVVAVADGIEHLGSQRSAIFAVLLNEPDGLSLANLKAAVWADQNVTDANVRTHVRRLHQLLDDLGCHETVVRSRAGATGFVLGGEAWTTDIAAFRQELSRSVGAWAAGDTHTAAAAADDALSYWRSRRPLVDVVSSEAVDSLADTLNHEFRIALWVCARAWIENGDLGRAITRLQWGLEGEHAVNAGLNAALIFALNQSGRGVQAEAVLTRLRSEFSIDSAPELVDCSAVHEVSRASSQLPADCLEQFDRDFGVRSLTSLQDPGRAPSESGRPPSESNEPNNNPRDSPRTVLVDSGEVSIIPERGDAGTRATVAVSVSKTSGSEARLGEVTSPDGSITIITDDSEEPLVVPSRAPRALIGVVASIAVFVALVAALLLRDGSPERQVVVAEDFASESTLGDWSATEESLGPNYLTGVANVFSTIEFNAAQGPSLLVVANPENLEAKSHHVSVASWLPGESELGIYVFSFRFYLPDTSAMLTQTGPEASVQISQDGVTTIAAMQAVPNPYVRELRIWSATDDGSGWHTLVGDYEPAVAEWVKVTLVFDMRTRSYVEMTLAPESGAAPLTFDLGATPLASDERGFADGLAVSLELENLWSDEVNPVAATAEMFYDDVSLELLRD